jgi:hypothetical protein
VWDLLYPGVITGKYPILKPEKDGKDSAIVLIGQRLALLMGDGYVMTLRPGSEGKSCGFFVLRLESLVKLVFVVPKGTEVSSLSLVLSPHQDSSQDTTKVGSGSHETEPPSGADVLPPAAQP